MAQVIGGETKYQSVFHGLRLVGVEEGPGGLFRFENVLFNALRFAIYLAALFLNFLENFLLFGAFILLLTSLSVLSFVQDFMRRLLKMNKDKRLINV